MWLSILGYKPGAVSALPPRRKSIIIKTMERNTPYKIVSQNGIVLGEILLLVILISLLAIIIIPRYIAVSREAKYESDSTNIANVDSLVQLYYIREGTWPLGDLTDIGTNTNYFPSATLPTCPITVGARYILVSPTHMVGGHSRGAAAHP
jgi:competence protein ComGC